MSDQDNMRKAVELADGFADSATLYWIEAPGEDDVEVNVSDVPKWFLAALAAQLVRQVDDLGFPYYLTIVATRSVLYRHPFSERIGLCSGKGRAVNTLNAVVNSKILE